MEVSDKVLAQGVALALRETLTRPEFQAELAERVAGVLAEMMEMVPPQAAAELLGKTERTLRDNAREWGLRKSVAFGSTNRVYFLSDILRRAGSKVIAGRRPADGGRGRAELKVVELARAS